MPLSFLVIKSVLIRLLAVCLLVGCASFVRADYRAAPGLDAMQRMQGQWQRHCYPSVDGQSKVYRRDFLVVSFTHLAFESKVYLDDACNAERTSYKATYRYTLTGAFFEARGGKKAFALNAKAESPVSDFFVLPPLNIAAVESGRLYFGRDFSGESEAGVRLSRLDVNSPFLRH
ncbi:hypothetical protein [Marinagarivorans cellulosilyticus]|uniref:Uncharacterized protein n=1 Tax=Marinagarivorans cellulosilyticus TaxID=2721545 RepID=A0AAN1WK09_9GAMM|nr:hypothetical protein [Marinagarivorans cellulosilyticus]BCD98994.1 hypothetical protein MARGE09_P3195 [Marinagarivorans cellulosilyticus]